MSPEDIDTPQAPQTPEPAPMPAPGAERAPLTKAERRAKWWADTKMDLKWATALLFVLILSVSGFLWSAWGREPVGEENLPAITTLIFAEDGLVAPFEILGVLLLAALIAGIVIAVKEPEGGI